MVSCLGRTIMLRASLGNPTPQTGLQWFLWLAFVFIGGWVGLAKDPPEVPQPLLLEDLAVDQVFEVDIKLDLKGELRLNTAKGMEKLPTEAKGHHHYFERMLNLGDTPHSTGPSRVARYYDKAQALVVAAGEKTERSLRDTRRIFLIQRTKEEFVTFCPEGPLTRSEQELTTDQFDTLAVSGLLPGNKQKSGDPWKIPNATVQKLCHFEGLIEQDLKGTMEKVSGEKAQFRVVGKASGIDQGAQVKAVVEAAGTFDFPTKTITDLLWKQTEERDAGPVNPAGTLSSTLTLKRIRIKTPASLSDKVMEELPGEKEDIPLHLLAIEHKDAKGRYELVHGRNWQIVAETNDHMVLRLLDRGDFIAQCVVTPWDKALKGNHMAPEDFRAAMNKTPGWRPEKELLADEIPGTEGRFIYRIAAQGKMDGSEVIQHFYLVASATGEQVVVTFTMTPRLVEKLGARDLNLIGGLLVPAMAPK